MILPRLTLLAALAFAAFAAPAGAASVAYIDGHDAWLSSPDGAQKYQLTSGGTEDASWMAPAQGADGKTVVVHRDQFESGERRPVLYLYGADGKLQTANVMPVQAAATAPVYPIGLAMDWNSKTVAFGYSYCGFACQTSYKGFWLTFSDQQPMNPSNPQGQSDAYNPTFVGTRVISSDSGGRIFVQPDVAEAPFTSSYQGWLEIAGTHLSRASVARTGTQVAVEWSRYEGSTKTGQGIAIGSHEGSVPSDVTQICDLPTAADPANASFSPDGTQIAWHDAEGVKVAGAPNLAAGTQDCTLTSPPKVLSASGRSPSFGGADVAAILGAAKPAPASAGGNADGTGGGSPVAALKVSLSGKATRAAFARGLKVKVPVGAAGRVSASASVPAKVARRLGLRAGASSAALANAASVRGVAAAKAVVVARGSATAKGAGTVTIRLKPTKAAKRAAKRLRGVTLTIKVAQGPANGTLKAKLR